MDFNILTKKKSSGCALFLVLSIPTLHPDRAFEFCLPRSLPYFGAGGITVNLETILGESRPGFLSYFDSMPEKERKNQLIKNFEFV